MVSEAPLVSTCLMSPYSETDGDVSEMKLSVCVEEPADGELT